MKKISLILIFISLLLTVKINAKTYKLNYEPSGIIIEILYGNLKIYTDTKTIFKLYADNQVFLNKVKNCVQNRTNDTITFNNQLYKTTNKKCQYSNLFENNNYLFINLIKNNKIKIVRLNGKRIKIIKTKREGKRWKHESITKNYIDKETGEKLFFEWIRLIITDVRTL